MFVFFKIGYFGLLSLFLFLFLTIKLVNNFNMGFQIPLLLLFLYSLQYLFVPIIVYQFPEFVVHSMEIDESKYFQIILPLFVCLSIGLFCVNTKDPLNKMRSIFDLWMTRSNTLGKASWSLLIIGAIASLFLKPTGSYLDFVFYLLKNLRFIGFFIILKNDRFNKILLGFLLSYGISIYESLTNGMFHDLIIWSIFGFYVLSSTWKFSNSVAWILFLIGSVFLIGLQTIKGDYRKNLSENNDALANVQISLAESQNNGSDAIWSSLERYNQGQIFSSVIHHLQKNNDFQKGSHMSMILRAVFFPRFLDPNKMRAGDQKIFMRYTDRVLTSNTSMAIGGFSDFFIDYGFYGACVMSFLLGLVLSLTLKIIALNVQFPIFYYFIPIVYLFIIRPDCELQTSLGHFFKTLVLIYFIYKLFQKELLFKNVR